MEYDSDSELRATDSLRLDSDSENGDLLHDTPTPESITDNVGQFVSTAVAHSFPSVASTEQLDECRMPSYNENVQSFEEQKRPAILSNIIDSESEDDSVPKNQVAEDKKITKRVNNNNQNMHRLKALVDSDSESDDARVIKRIPLKKQKKKSRNRPETAGEIRKSTDEKDEGSGNEISSPILSSKRINHTGVKKAVSPVATAKDMLASLNLFFDDAEDEIHANENNTILNSVSDDDSEIGNRQLGKSFNHKMTEKQALEERQIIQSESQRMAREAYIDVPYHRTKTYSFEEFLARKTIRKPNPSIDCLDKSSELSIKMTPVQLEIFARQLKERELESQEFFKSESESSSDEEFKTDRATPAEVPMKQGSSKIAGNMNAECIVDSDILEEEIASDSTNKCQENIISTTKAPVIEHIDNSIDGIVNQTSENVEKLITDVHQTECSVNANTNEKEMHYDLIPPTQNNKIRTKKCFAITTLNLPPCPRLSGHSDMLIDLDSGTLQPKEPSGVDILFQRFTKCTGGAKKSASSPNTISELDTVDGVVKLQKISLFTEEERPLVHKEPIPGAAYMKLKQALKEKIDNDRRAVMRKRKEEHAKKIAMEKKEMGYETDEDEEEFIDGEEVTDGKTEEKPDVAGQQNNFSNNETIDDDVMDEDDVNDSDETSENSSNSDDDEQCEADDKQTVRRKGRIVKAFEDSDDDSVPEKLHDISQVADTDVQERLTQVKENEQTPNIGILKDTNYDDILHPWKRDERGESVDNDLMELCSGQFVTQLPFEVTQTTPRISKPHLISSNDDGDNDKEIINKKSQISSKPLYTQADHSIQDSQLMELCSGRFETQLSVSDELVRPLEILDKNSGRVEEKVDSDNDEIVSGGKLCIYSSDDETGQEDVVLSKRTKKRRRTNIQISDDEENTNEHEQLSVDSLREHSNSDVLSEEQHVGCTKSDEDAEEAERYVDYDSEENEVEVTLSKDEKQRILANFVQNEAELSESEWGSADEDEKDLDRYDVELADEEQFDQHQLQQELEKIHNRRMLDQDNREVEQLKDFFLENEENDGVGRVRQFRWKNVEKTFTLDYDKQKDGVDGNEEGAGGEASDEETELAWRKMRHERNLLLKEQNKNFNETELTTTALFKLNPEDPIVAADAQENNESMSNVNALVKKKVTIVKRTTTATAGKEDSPFLISKSSVFQGHKASFLSRDAETLNKLANLVKSNPDTEGTSTVMAANGRNFVFAALSPALEKSAKRSLETNDAEEKDHIKRAKTTCKETTSKKKLLLGSLL